MKKRTIHGPGEVRSGWFVRLLRWLGFLCLVLAVRSEAQTVVGGNLAQAEPVNVSGSTVTVVGVNGAPILVSNTSLPLPSGAATEVTLAGQLRIHNSTITVVGLNGAAITISAASLPLPSGAATEATVNSLLKAGQTISVSTTGVGPQSVTGPLTDEQLRLTAVAMSAASLPLPADATTGVFSFLIGPNVTCQIAAYNADGTRAGVTINTLVAT